MSTVSYNHCKKRKIEYTRDTMYIHVDSIRSPYVSFVCTVYLNAWSEITSPHFLDQRERYLSLSLSLSFILAHRHLFLKCLSLNLNFDYYALHYYKWVL